MHLHMPISRKQRLIATILISLSFFVAELVIGFMTHSLALIADAFHYLNDLVGFVVALTALLVSEKEHAPPTLSYGWHRASTVGAFFNGVFLLALGLSILLQSVERFMSLEHVKDPFMVLVTGCIGLGLNIITIIFLHEHDHGHGHGLGPPGDTAELEIVSPIVINDASSQTTIPGSSEIHTVHHEHKHNSAEAKAPGRDLGMLGVLIHVIGDAINNIGVIVSAIAIWKTTSPARFYADPAVSMFIALMILLTSWPLVKNSGYILLQGAPFSVDLDDVRHDLEKIEGIDSVHELHVWRLDQNKSIASVHVVVSDKSMADFMEKAKTIGECLHAYGIHSVTLQPELYRAGRGSNSSVGGGGGGGGGITREAVSTATDARAPSPTHSVGSAARRLGIPPRCQLICGSVCEGMKCCARK